jgi:hypothetical protein
MTFPNMYMSTLNYFYSDVFLCLFRTWYLQYCLNIDTHFKVYEVFSYTVGSFPETKLLTFETTTESWN